MAVSLDGSRTGDVAIIAAMERNTAIMITGMTSVLIIRWPPGPLGEQERSRHGFSVQFGESIERSAHCLQILVVSAISNWRAYKA